MQDLNKKVTWKIYKEKYGPEYSYYEKTRAVSSEEVRSNYKAQAQAAKNKFNAKFFTIQTSDVEKAIEERDALLKSLKTNYLQKTINSVSSDFKALDKKKGGNYSPLQNALVQLAKSKPSSSEYRELQNKAQSVLKATSNYLNVTIPEDIAKMLTEDKENPVEIGSIDTMKFLRGSRSAVTSFNVLESKMKELENYIASGMSGSIAIGRGEYQKVGESFVSVETGQSPKKGEIARRLGGYMGLITGQVFESVVTAALGNAMSDISRAVKNVGGDVTAGERSKDDIVIDIDGVKLMASLSEMEGWGGTDANVAFQENIQLGASAKKKGLMQSNTFLQSSLGTLYNMTSGNIDMNRKGLFWHYMQIGAPKDAEMDILNRYITSKMANKVLGSDIDFMLFLDKVVPQYEFLETLAKNPKRWLYMVHKGNKSFTDSPSTIPVHINN